jgi:hypothetical protein
MNTQWNITLEEDANGELILPLGDEILEAAGWKTGDTIEWIDNKDGSWTMQKAQEKEQTQWVLVETVQMFHHRYMVEVPVGTDKMGRDKSEWALDSVAMEDAKEFSQEHLGETIVSHRVIDEKDALALCDVDNAYCRGWSTEQKKDAFFTGWNESWKE